MNKRSATIRVWNLLDHTRINERSFITDMLKKRSFYLAAIVTFLLLLFSFGQSAAAADLPEANLASSTPKVMETRDNNFIPSTIRFIKRPIFSAVLSVLIIIVGIAFVFFTPGSGGGSSSDRKNRTSSKSSRKSSKRSSGGGSSRKFQPNIFKYA